jgi:Flp pilus assembly secretin CpaC
MLAAFLAGRRSRELYPALWFLGRVEPAIPPKTAYVETGSTLYVATNLKVPRLAVGNRSICEAQPDTPTQFQLMGKTAGTTTVLFWLEGREEPVELSVVVAPKP